MAGDPALDPALFAHRNPTSIAAFARIFGPFARTWFRYTLRGLERLPPPPCLVVGNHSGFGTYEIPCMISAWTQQLGTDRPVHGLAHESGLRIPIWGRWEREMGALPASRETALVALRAGRDVMVFPGGEADACRPVYHARRVVFGKRRGYARLALEAGVPIVPLATIGSHYTVPMAPGGTTLARLLGLKRLMRLETVPLPIGWITAVAALGGTVTGHLPVVLGGLVATAGLLPVPARITSEFLAPIDVSAATANLPEDARVEAAHELVYSALSAAVATMKHEPTQAAT
ncbi:MAG: lysophospholipid acyltransferase family protein [Polyangiaceae bacterium]